MSQCNAGKHAMRTSKHFLVRRLEQVLSCTQDTAGLLSSGCSPSFLIWPRQLSISLNHSHSQLIQHNPTPPTYVPPSSLPKTCDLLHFSYHLLQLQQRKFRLWKEGPPQHPSHRALFYRMLFLSLPPHLTRSVQPQSPAVLLMGCDPFARSLSGASMQAAPQHSAVCSPRDMCHQPIPSSPAQHTAGSHQATAQAAQALPSGWAPLKTATSLSLQHSPKQAAHGSWQEETPWDVYKHIRSAGDFITPHQMKFRIQKHSPVRIVSPLHIRVSFRKFNASFLKFFKTLEDERKVFPTIIATFIRFY